MSTQMKLAAFGVALALAVSGCGGSDNPDEATVRASSPTTENSAVATADEVTTTDQVATTTPSSTERTSTLPPSTATTASDTADAEPTTSSSATDTLEPATTEGPKTSEVAAEDPTTTTVPVSIPEAAEEFVEPSEDELIEAVTRSLVDDQQTETYPTSEPELRCVSATVVEDVGKDKLVAAGMAEDGSGTFRPADLESADQEILIDAFLSCVNIENVFASQIGDGDIDETTARCLAREMNDNGLLVELIRPSILGQVALAIEDQNASTQDAFLEAFRACLDFEDEMARGFMQDGIVSEKSARCLASRMNEEGLLEQIMRTQVTGVDLTPEQDADAQSLMLDLARECLTTEEAERLSLG